ncbi:MAG: PilZ domain-containing protein [Acidobacteria bacterium]|nr:PilZ domain-containing protein [Acidobacteriota bacterium]
MVAGRQCRAYPRVVPKKTVFVEYPNYLARVRNLSLVGAFIEDTRPFPPGQTVEFSLWLDDQEAVPVRAQVRRVERDGMGVEFLRLLPPYGERLRNFVRGTQHWTM